MEYHKRTKNKYLKEFIGGFKNTRIDDDLDIREYRKFYGLVFKILDNVRDIDFR